MNKLEKTFLKRVRQAQYFSLLADEATDSGNWEKLAVNLHFVDESDEVHKISWSSLNMSLLLGST